jgi:hypothetical protein
MVTVPEETTSDVVTRPAAPELVVDDDVVELLELPELLVDVVLVAEPELLDILKYFVCKHEDIN